MLSHGTAIVLSKLVEFVYKFSSPLCKEQFHIQLSDEIARSVICESFETFKWAVVWVKLKVL
jgi:hypothetical protein